MRLGLLVFVATSISVRRASCANIIIKSKCNSDHATRGSARRSFNSHLFHDNDMLMTIASMFDSPHDVSIPSKAFCAALRAPLRRRLSDRIGWNFSPNLHDAPDLQRFYYLLVIRFPWMTLSHVLSSSSVFLVESEAGIILAGDFFSAKQDVDSEERTLYFFNLITRLVRTNKLNTLSFLLKNVSHIRFDQSIMTFLNAHVLSRLATICHESALNLLEAHMSSRKVEFSSAIYRILLVAVPASVINSFLLTHFLHPVNNGILIKVVSGIRDVCVSKGVELSLPEYCITFYQRNNAVLSQIAQLMPTKSPLDLFRIMLAQLVNKIRFGTESDDVLEADVVNLLNQSEYILRTISYVFAAALHSQRRTLFQRVFERVTQISLEPTHQCAGSLILELVAMMLDVNHFSIKISHEWLTGVEHKAGSEMNRLKAEEFRMFTILEMRLRIAIGTCNMDEFKCVFKVLATQKKEAFRLLRVLIEEADNPVPFVTAALPFLYPEEYHCAVGAVLGKEKYLRALLLDEANGNVSFEQMSRFKINLSDEAVEALISDTALAVAFGSERARPIRECVASRLVDLYSATLDGLQLLRLLNIASVPTNNRLFNVPITDDCLMEFDEKVEHGLFLCSAEYTNSPHFLPCLAFRMFAFEIGDKKPFKASIRAGDPNPLLLHNFALLDMWHRISPVNFYDNAPPLAVRAFVPRSSRAVLEDVLNRNGEDEALDRMARVYLRDVHLIMTFTSEFELDAFKTRFSNRATELLKKHRFTFDCIVSANA